MRKMAYVAGIIQGSREDDTDHEQSYRETLTTQLHHPGLETVYPCELTKYTSYKTPKDQKKIFEILLQKVRESDLFVGYFHEANNGTAIELYEAYRNHMPTLVIAKLRLNWAIHAFSNKVLYSLDEFHDYVSSGQFAQRYINI